MRKAVNKENCLAILNPELVKEWHPTKNRKLTSFDVVSGSGKKVWWKCSICGYEWKAKIIDRGDGQKKCKHCNSLATKNPELAKEWHPTKNGNLTAFDVSPSSHKKAWWKCSVCHKIRKTRINSLGDCDCTRSLAIKNPELAKEWYSTKNGKLTAFDVYKSSDKKVWWKCSICGHVWLAKIRDRNHGLYKCIYHRSLGYLNPELAKEWHPTKNGKLTAFDILPRSNKKVWWKCSICGHVWMAVINERGVGKGQCIYHRSLGYLYPELAKEWHPIKNGELIPYGVLPHTKKKVWWIDDKKHEWMAIVGNRVNGTNCPYCDGKQVCKDNCLATKNPELIKEWHPTKNGNLTAYDVTSKSDKKVWWKCSVCNHNWFAAIKHRTAGEGCPLCIKIILIDNTVCDSYVEAFFYLKYKRSKLKFEHNKKYDLKFGGYRYDFYFPVQNKYIEVTSFTEKWTHWKDYLKKINLKKQYVEGVLKAKFEFIQYVPSEYEYQYVRENIA